MPDWTPPAYGALSDLSPSLAPLAPYADRATVVSGLDATATNVGLLGFHRRATASWLTCTEITPTFDPAELTNGWSIDQLIADQFHADTAIPSLQVGQPMASVPEDPDKPYSAVYMQTLSWRGNLPLMCSFRPMQLWRKLIGGVGQPVSEVDVQILKRRGGSVLDAALSDLDRMKNRLGVADTVRLDEYLTSLRALEQDVDALSSTPLRCTESADAFSAYSDDIFDYDSHIDLMFRLTAMLMACDATRVATLMISAATPSRVYRELGHELDHHVLSHHNGDEDWIRKTADIDYAQTSFLVRFLDELAARTDAEGSSLLDDTLVMYGSGMGDGSLHDWRNVPMLYVGDARGRLRTGRHIDATGRPLADLHLTTLRAMGLSSSTFADATGTLSDIEV
jgi:hypothetical protein